MKRSKTNSGFLYFIEKIVRCHPLLYFVTRYFIRYTNIFEEDANGVSFLNLDRKVNIIDVGASDGIASKFFNRKLKINKIICFEPNKSYVKILKKLNIKKLIVNPYGISQSNKYYEIFFPRYRFFSKNLDLITYAHYSKKTLLNQINLDFKFKKNISIIKTKIKVRTVKKEKRKIHLIKIDTNGYELPIIKGLNDIIKRDRSAIIVESNHDIKKIDKILSKYSYKSYYFLPIEKKFKLVNNKYPLNTFFLQKKHLI